MRLTLINSIAPVLIIANIWHIPESPRWLVHFFSVSEGTCVRSVFVLTQQYRFVQKDRTEDALAALQRLRDSPEDIEFEMQEMRNALAFEKESISGAYWPLWTDKTVRYRLGMATISHQPLT